MATNPFTVEVLTPAQAVERLIALGELVLASSPSAGGLARGGAGLDSARQPSLGH